MRLRQITVFGVFCATALLASHSMVGARGSVLSVSNDGRCLVREDGTPFFWLGDTAWELFHRLDREEAELYLETRARQGFTVIQAVVLAELDGLNTPNSYGHRPLLENDPLQPREAYFQHVDFVIEKANQLGLIVAVLPTWGDKWNKKWGIGPEVFSPENAHSFGVYLGKRYKDRSVVWVLGGDRNPDEEDDIAITRAMAKGLHEGDDGRRLMTFHPQGGFSSSDFFEKDRWIDFHMFQSGHAAIGGRNYTTSKRVAGTRPRIPVLDGEPNYEDHPVDWNPDKGWFDEFDSRRAGYWSMLAGAMGHTYGHHSVWQMWQPGRDPISAARTPWREAIQYPGAVQAGIMRRFFESLPWHLLEHSEELLTAASDKPGTDTLAAIASDRSFLAVYSPFGEPFVVDSSQLHAANLRAVWHNPRDGSRIELGSVAPAATKFDPPGNSQRGNDWLLVVQAQD